MKTRHKSRIYPILILMALVLSMITFTPLVMPYGKHTPTFLHLPYTLWTGILVALLLVFLTWQSVRNHPGKEEDRP